MNEINFPQHHVRSQRLRSRWVWLRARWHCSTGRLVNTTGNTRRKLWRVSEPKFPLLNTMTCLCPAKPFRRACLQRHSKAQQVTAYDVLNRQGFSRHSFIHTGLLAELSAYFLWLVTFMIIYIICTKSKKKTSQFKTERMWMHASYH